MATSKIKESLFNDPSNFDIGQTDGFSISAGDEDNKTINFNKEMGSNVKGFVQIVCPSGYAQYLMGHIKTMGRNSLTYCIKNTHSSKALTVYLHWMVIN